MSIHFFKIERRSIFNEKWGDYGDILQHGMSSHLPRQGGLLALERTGPFIPPITLPQIGDIVLTSAARESLDASALIGFEFRPVHKVLTVELHWEHWDLNADEPRQFPDTGEPEDTVPATATVLRPQPIVHSYRDLKLATNTWNGTAAT